MSNRKDNRIEWFYSSLAHQLLEIKNNHPEDAFYLNDKIKIIVINFHFPPDSNYGQQRIDQISNGFKNGNGGRSWILAGSGMKHPKETSPKPTVWQGSHRLTKENWFAASNARNTALCLADTDWIAFVDDLSCLAPNWLKSVLEAMEQNYIVFGAYQKVKDLVVENGLVKSFTDYPQGHDSRWNQTNGQDLFSCGGSWLFGCSCAMPVEALLEINGWPEGLCDGLGSEDYCCGIVLGNTGKYSFRYDRRMFSYESEELHHVEPAFIRKDFGKSPNDKSHAALNIAMQSKRFPNHLDIRELRNKVLAGEPFPTTGLNPEHEWFSGVALKDL